MSVELLGVLIAVVVVGATLAGLMLAGQRSLRAELAAQRRETNERFTALDQQIAAHRQEFRTELAAQRQEFRTELAAQRQEFRTELAAQRQYFDERFAALEQRFTALEQQIAELRERMAHLEGLLDGLREAIVIRQGAAA